MTGHLWEPSASLVQITRRGAILRSIREYFFKEKVLEVETPMLSHYATVDPHIDSFQTTYRPLGTSTEETLFLHTSPEFPMKRLLAAGSGDIYYLGRVFRNGEAGGRHNPEFTMLEWYRLGLDHCRLMDDVTHLLKAVTGFEEVGRITYRELFEETFAIDPHSASDSELMMLTHEYVDSSLTDLARNDYLDLLFSTCIEPRLGGRDGGTVYGVYVYDYPASMSALSQVVKNSHGQLVAARFELFACGCELANGYYELADGAEQQARFEHDQQVRKAMGKALYPYDQKLVDALHQGFPECAGVAMGIDRLHMLIEERKIIGEVIPFDYIRA